MKRKTGLLIAGVGGAIGSTTVAGVNLLVQGKRQHSGMFCESTMLRDNANYLGETVAEIIAAPALEDMLISGWDLPNEAGELPTLQEALFKHQVLSGQDIAEVDAELLKTRPMCAPLTRQTGSSEDEWGWRINRIRKDIRDFKVEHSLDTVVVVNALPTEVAPVHNVVHDDLTALQAACAADDVSISTSMQYACAALLESCAYANFTPNPVEFPSILKLATGMGVPLMGHDGKTGQTLLKTALAPVFALRNLQVQGWFSTNILGNQDGRALHEPDACQTKIDSKSNCLDDILGYPVADHQVHIHYYKPRKDNKEAWDNIDLAGFLDYPLEIKVNFLCRDSILAAPIVVDVARLLAVSMQRGEHGLRPHLSVFFKSPQVPDDCRVEHDLFRQRQMLLDWVDAVALHREVKTKKQDKSYA